MPSSRSRRDRVRSPGPAPIDLDVLLLPISIVLHRLHAWLTTLVLAALSLGPVPHHVGFVMDGNRRYARTQGQAVARGHEEGFESLKRTLQICLRLQIRVVSVYAFAIDNFNRSQEEVDALMSLAKRSLLGLCREGEFLQAHGVRVKCVGRSDLLSPDVREALQKVEAMTANNTQGVLNVCGPYASRDEITTAVKDTVTDVNTGALSIDDLTQDQIFDRLETCRSAALLTTTPPPLPCTHTSGSGVGGKLDILVRTSDVKRLSDFMMWQASEGTQVHFVKTYWPEFGLTDMLPILLGWQQKMWLRQLGW